MFYQVIDQPGFWLKVVGVLVGFIVYVFIYRANRIVAYVILGAIICWLLYHNVDWQHWNMYFKVHWDLGRYR